MRPTRQTQPFRAGTPRQPGAVLLAMLRGRDLYGQQNAADTTRAGYLLAAARGHKRHKRPARPQRPQRPAR